ncbi:MAG: LysR substrate-binding domain-containing protein [Methylobacterium radiotolerans]
MGVAFLPRFVVAAELRGGLLEAVPLRDAILSEASAHLVVRAGRRLPEARGGCSAGWPTTWWAFRPPPA